ncbi:cell division protein FtsQ/DivIB [Bacillus sp. 7884-1]|jgi:cell division protein FtsQ|uniref:cell division protein FtsQ/DivIB n=1 Tax=Bacillus sp. 7884-1 TaxID=2021693 RepID=UPI000BA624E8|nr:cell division protein FtsQ/DivIB [Bacillus sp. 7884-1]PAE43288.1 cell division protein FtsQ [Bacillus sp. 7884-1]
MDKGKIVALEDRIPKLKEQRRRKANRRLIILLFLFFTMIAVVAYVQSPLSHVKKITIKGNDLLSTNEIISTSHLSKKTNIWSVKKDSIALNLQKVNVIKEAKVKIVWPNTVMIEIEERKKIAYLESDNSYYPVMENGKILKDREVSEIPVSAPILFKFKEGAILKEMVSALEELPDEVLNAISEVHYTPKKTDQYHISLFMNDGFEVSATLRSFSEKMIHYPSIISQLDPNKKGIIDLEVGSYFKAYELKADESEESEIENDKGEG